MFKLNSSKIIINFKPNINKNPTKKKYFKKCLVKRESYQEIQKQIDFY